MLLFFVAAVCLQYWEEQPEHQTTQRQRREYFSLICSKKVHSSTKPELLGLCYVRFAPLVPFGLISVPMG